MKARVTQNRYSKHHNVWLYSAVFGGRIFSVFAILLLCASFMIQPFHQAFAAESEESATSTTPSVAADVKEQTSEPELEPETEPEPQAEAEDEAVEDTATESVEPSTEAPKPVSESTQQQSAQTTTPVAKKATSSPATQPKSSSTPVTSGTGATTQNNTATTTNTSNATTTPPVTPEPPAAASTTETESSTGSGGGTQEPAEETGNEPATAPEPEETTEPAEESPTGSGEGGSADPEEPVEEEVIEENLETQEDTVVQLSYAISDENYYQFNKQSCIAVGDGTFHCSQKTTDEIDSSSAVFADVGTSGNLEIFLRTTKGEVKQLTDNNRDDTAPHYDPESMQIVWQRMVDSRYQIILYDLDTQEETQLTFSRTNNMEPKVSPDGIVWQAWDGNDWEVMYFDGTYTDQITDNSAQDVTPVIQDGYVVWSVLGGESNLARVYSISTGEMMSITGHEGGTIANPRFVLVYDTQFENGDIITQGFDPETGMAKPISAQGGPQPVNLPNKDTTGETIALIQNKSSSKDEKGGLIVKTDGNVDPDVSTTTGSTTTTLILDTETGVSTTTAADIDTSLDDEVSSSSPVVEEDFALDEFDLVIIKEGNEIVSTSTREDIPTIDREVIEAERASSSQSINR